MENYEFSRVGTGDGFHVHESTHLKNHFSFKNKYTVTRLGLKEHNKRFLQLTNGAPESIQDHRLLWHATSFQEIIYGNIIPNKGINLGDAVEITLVTIADSAFPRLQRSTKSFNQNTREQKNRYFNKTLYSARVVSEHAYGMLKWRWQVLYKKYECKLYNTKYVIVEAALLHYICIYKHDLCKSRWRLDVEHLELVNKQMI